MTVLFIGPTLNPVTGQSFHFNEVCKYFSDGDILNYPVFNGKKLSYFFYTGLFFFHFIRKIMFMRYESVYFTGSRSLIGFVRDLFVIIFCSFKSVSLINHIHGSDFSSFRNKYLLLRPVIDWAYNRLDCIICLDKSMKSDFHRYIVKKEIIPNFSSVMSETGKTFPLNSEVNVLYLSNIIYSKGILHLIDAIDHLVLNENKEIHLYVAGDFIGDEYYSKIQIETLFKDKINGKGHITYLGFLNETNKNSVFQMCHLLALPSFYRSEAQPICIIEGISYGMPILTTNFSYLPNLVDSDSGFLASPESADSIIEGLNYLMDCDQWNKIYNYNYSHYRYQFSKYNAFNKLQKILEIK